MTSASREVMEASYDASKLGQGCPSHTAVELAANDPVEGVAGGRLQNTARYHSVLAMEAARKMRRTRQKKKTGQEVCHHLKMMLSSGSVVENPKPEAGQIHFGF